MNKQSAILLLVYPDIYTLDIPHYILLKASYQTNLSAWSKVCPVKLNERRYSSATILLKSLLNKQKKKRNSVCER